MTSEFREFYRLGRDMRVTLPTGRGGVVHIFVVCGYQGAEEDSDKLALTNKLLNAVLAEAQVVCGGQPVLIAGDLNANPEVISCLAKRIASGKFIDLALAYSTGSGCAPEVTCRFKLEEGAGSRRDFMVACPYALAASSACRVTDRWFTPHFSILAEFSFQQWNAEVACPLAICPLSRFVRDAWRFMVRSCWVFLMTCFFV